MAILPGDAARMPLTHGADMSDSLRSILNGLLLSGVLLCPPVVDSAAGQAAAPAAPAASTRELGRKLITREQVLPVLRDGSGDSPQASVEPKFLLLGSTGGGVTAKARIGWLLRNDVFIDGIVSGPLAGGEAELVSLTGLNNNVSLQLRAQYAKKWTNTDKERASARNLRSAVPEECDSAADLDYAICLAAARAADNLSADRATRRLKDPGVKPLTRNGLRDAILSGNVPLARGKEEAVEPAELRKAFAREMRRMIREGVVETNSSVFLSGSYLTSNQRFSFADPATLAAQTANRTGNSFELGAGFARSRGSEPLFYVGAGYELGTTYAGQPKSTICQPFVASSLRCRELAVGGPTESDVNSVNIDARVWLLASKLALNARFIRDIEGEINTIEFPVYFLKNVKDIEDDAAAETTPALTGGVTAGWRSGAQRDFYVYFFVGTVLGLPGLP